MQADGVVFRVTNIIAIIAASLANTCHLWLRKYSKRLMTTKCIALLTKYRGHTTTNMIASPLDWIHTW